MRILHTSDWHLGMNDVGKSLYDDQKYFINDICRIVEENNVNAVIIAGDVYDKSNLISGAVELYDYAMTRLCVELGRDVIVIAGNHDSAERIDNCSELLAKAGLHALGAVSDKPAVVKYEDTDIWLMPWVKESKVKSLYPDEADNINSLQDAYRILCNKMTECFEQGKKNILVSHSFMTNAVVSESDRAAKIGFADQVGVEVFQAFDYIALGHIHKPQDVGSNARYSGTPMPYSFGQEEKQEKSVTIIDTETMEREIVPVRLLHKRATVTGTLNEILEGDYPEEILNGYTSIVITDVYAGLDVISRINRKFRNAIQITGKSFEAAGGSITMTMDEMRELESNPIEIFRSFYRDTMDGEPDDRLVEMFAECMNECEEA